MLLFGITVSAGAFQLLGAAIAGLLARGLPALFSQRGINAEIANMIFGFLLMFSLTAAPEGAAGQLTGLARSVRAKLVPDRNRPVPTDRADRCAGRDHRDRRRCRGALVIDIDRVTVQFGGVRPLDDLTLQLDGNIVGIVGPNGAGKTTLLNVMSGFVDGEHGLDHRRRHRHPGDDAVQACPVGHPAHVPDRAGRERTDRPRQRVGHARHGATLVVGEGRQQSSVRSRSRVSRTTPTDRRVRSTPSNVASSSSPGRSSARRR